MERKVFAVINKAEKILVTMHVNPDPDAMGSAVAMTLYLKSLGKNVRLYNADVCPKWLTFMPKVSLCRVAKGKDRFKPDLVVVLDCGDLDRVGSVRTLIGSAPVINIDHHITNHKFGTYNIVRTQYSSTSEILYQLLKSAHAPMTRDMAILLYLGILTDTGSFGFDCTTSHTHAVIADLLRFNVPVADLYRQVYETLPKEDLKAFLSVMNCLELDFDGRVASLILTRKSMTLFSDGFDLREKVFSFMRVVHGLEVIVIYSETGDGRVRVNFRSRGSVDVASIAAIFGGGGHKKASGCYFKGSMVQTRKAIVSALAKGM